MSTAGDRIPVLLDTDIGTDIDDAVCLSYLLAQRRCELLGVTTVSGQPRVRASLVDAVCRAAGRLDVPIHVGSEINMATGQVVQPDVQQARVLPRFPHRPPGQFEPGTAIEFLRSTIRKRPGEITLLAIGPMTNLGLLFTLDPEIPRLLKSLVLMCGVFKGDPRQREWNALCDPVATAHVYRAACPSHISIGLDVTTKCIKPASECKDRFNAIGGSLTVVSAMTEVWGEHANQVIFHDPLAATMVFKPSLCGMQRAQVSVEMESRALAGITYLDQPKDGAPAPHQVALEVDAPAFFTEYFGVVSGQGS
jgi:purine nucleosidase